MIVMNTLTGAVSEYGGFSFDSMTETHAAKATGMYTLGGDTDNGEAIIAEVVTGKPLWGDQRKKRMDMVWLSMKGEGTAELIVQGENDEWRYSFPVRASGQSRAKPGLGIRENYLAFGVSNPGGEAFTLDQISVSAAQSNTRRV